MQARRFTEEQFKELIQQTEKYFRVKPSVADLTNYYNRFILSEDDFENNEEYESMKISRYVVHYYIKIFKCADLIAMGKFKKGKN